MGSLGVFLASYWCEKEMRSIKFFWSSADASGEASGTKGKKEILWSQDKRFVYGNIISIYNIFALSKMLTKLNSFKYERLPKHI